MIIRRPPEVNFSEDKIIPLTNGGERNSVIQQTFEHRLEQLNCPASIRPIFHQELRFGRPYLRNPLAHRKEFEDAAEKIMAAVRAQKKIVLFGDYDCDGVTSVALLHDFLMAAGLLPENCGTFIPDRSKHGYGLTMAALESCVPEHKPELLIVLDCGTKSHKEIEWLNENQIDSVVVDHHLPDKELIKTVLINPKAWPSLTEQEWELKLLSAAGLSFLLVAALAKKLNLITWSLDRAYLIAGLGTYVDMVPLIGINRTLVKHSLYLAKLHFEDRQGIRNSQLQILSPGLASLERIRKENEFTAGPLTETTYGYYLGPCLNAPGRLHDPKDALKLLLARDDATAEALARKCFEFNEDRKRIQKQVTEHALELAQRQRHSKVILLAEKGWDAGVVGIVASDVKEMCNRPVIVCAWQQINNGDGYWKGSGRSIEKYNLGAKIQEAVAAGLIIRGGGHEMAGGLSFYESQRETLEEWLNDNSGLDDADFFHKAEIIAEAESFGPAEWYSIYRALEPFGMGNLEPSLVARNVGLTTAPTPLRPKSPIGSSKQSITPQLTLFGRTPEPTPDVEPDNGIWGMRGNFEKYQKMIKIDSTNLEEASKWTVGERYNFDLVLTEWESAQGKLFYGFRVRPPKKDRNKKRKC